MTNPSIFNFQRQQVYYLNAQSFALHLPIFKLASYKSKT